MKADAYGLTDRRTYELQLNLEYVIILPTKQKVNNYGGCGTTYFRLLLAHWAHECVFACVRREEELGDGRRQCTHNSYEVS